MIKSFEHKGLQAFFETGSKAGIQPHHAPKLARQLARLNAAKVPEDMNLPGWRLHPLVGSLTGHYSVSINGNWRLTFEFKDGNVYVLDYEDYH